MSEVSQKKFKISISAVLLLCLMVLFVIYSSSLFLIRDARAAAVSWDGGGDGVFWEDPLNWSGDAVPTAVDDVTIDSDVTVDIGPSVAPSAILQFAMNDNAATTTVVDATATSNGTADQNTSVLTASGKIGSALAFNGSTDHIDVSFAIPTEDFTYAVWVNLDTNNDELIFRAPNTTGSEFHIYINSGGNVSIWIDGATAMTSTSSVATGGWHHVAVTRNGGLVKTYIDGTLDVTTGVSGATLDFEGCQATLGAGSTCTTSGTNWFDGAMDDFRVYGEALSIYEISQIYNSGTGTEAALSSNRASTINSLTLGNSGGTTSSTLRFIYDAVGTSDALAIDATDLTVHTGATVSTTYGSPSIYFDVQTGNATIDGTVSADYWGYGGSGGPEPGTEVSTTGGGGGHGGEGGTTQNLLVARGVGGSIDGEIIAPVTSGSGGGSADGNAGGLGGGVIRMDVAGDTDIDGTITADGHTPVTNRNPGGGAGGSVYITTAGTLTGTGTIGANGGNGDANGGGGAGGRIALHYDADTSSITETAYGGTSPGCGYCFGGAGTIYLNDTTGADTDTLIIDNNSLDSSIDYFFGRTLLVDASTTFDNLTLQNDGQLDLASGKTLIVNSTLTWTNDGTLVDNGGTFDFISNSSNSLTLPSGAKLYANTARTFVNINVDSGATITGSNNSTTGAGKVYEVNLTATGNLTMDGTVDADIKGYYSASGPNPGTEVSTYGGGGGHGGEGGSTHNLLIARGVGGSVDGEITAPVTIGSGGATGDNNSGGFGGGAVHFTVSGDTDIDGTITADGHTPVTNRSPGGGAGGSVYITTVGTLTGTGSIGANGGNGDAGGGGGAGGRIALHYDADTSTITETAYGGTSGGCSWCFGGAGTIYLNDTTGADTATLVVDNNSLSSTIDLFFGKTPLTKSPTDLDITVDTVDIQDDGYLDLNSNTILRYTTLNWSTDGVITDNGGTLAGVTSGNVSVPSGATLLANTTRSLTTMTVGGTLSHSGNNASAVYDMVLSTSGDFTVSSGGSVSTTGKGFSIGNGAGAGEDSGSYGSGAGHGGAGGVSTDGGSTAGSTYDFTGVCVGGACDTASPTTLGSGGGNGDGAQVIPEGGGAIKLTIGGDLTLTGNIDSNARTSGGSNTGGGSGGSVWLDITGNASGSGTLSADGGDAQTANAGAGGGGRISITCASDPSWTATISVDAGSVGGAGSAGSLSDSCTGGLPPTSSVNAAAQKTNGSGHVDLSIELDDVEDDDVKLKIEYETDSDASCDGPWSGATLTGLATADFNDSGGAPDVGVGAYQVGSVATKRVITSSGPNNVQFDWDSKADLPSANGTQCLRFTANDDVSDATPVTQTLTVDNVVPTVASSVSYKDITVVDGTVDRVDVVFTENVTLSSYNTADWVFITPGDITLDDTGASVSTTTVRLTVTADANETGGSTAPTLSYTNNSRLTDTYGNELASFGPTTVTDGAGPFILLTDPADGATDTAIGDDVVVTFTEAINTATDAYTWSDAPAGVTDAWTASDTVITISHTGSFSIGSHTFTMTVASDGTGNAFAGSVSGVTHPVDFETVAPPSGSTVISYVSNNAVSINEGDECSASRTVVLQLTAKKATSVLIGHDDLFQDSIRVDFVSDTMINNVPVMFYTWTMNEGEDTVYVQYRSSTSTASSRVSDSIVVDTINLCIEHIDSDETTEAPLTDVFGVSPITGEVEAISEINAHDYIQGDFFTDIYYVDSEINRHPLVDPRTILTWGKDLSVIKHVTDATLGTLGIGKLFLPKPGTTLLKFLDNPDVFTIDENAGDFYHPILRHIPSEKTAEKMFGSNWQDYIYELNQAHFHEFAIGKKIPEEGIVIDISQFILLK